MPTAFQRRCLDCHRLTLGTRCAEHARIKRQDERRRHTTTRGVNYGRRWRILRVQQLAKYPLCAMCQAKGILAPATDVDHVTPHLGDYEAFWRGPFQSLCHRCHSTKTAAEVGWHGGHT